MAKAHVAFGQMSLKKRRPNAILDFYGTEIFE
jgi:hypothetical protein